MVTQSVVAFGHPQATDIQVGAGRNAVACLQHARPEKSGRAKLPLPGEI